MIRLTTLLGNAQRLDGGAMFGNVPKALWQRWLPPDEANRVPLACRCLLIEDGDRRILCETGIGAFFEPKLRERFGVRESAHVLLDSLRAEGVSHEDIDVVVLSHLHFDHAGGLLTAWNENEPSRLLFPKARFVVGERAWQRSRDPHPRDRASFIPNLPGLLEESGRLEVVSGDRSETLGSTYRLHVSEGHTPGMLVSEILTDEGPVAFVADLVPGRPWTHVPITMGYDRYAERLIDEKRALFDELHPRKARLFYTHDPEVGLALLTKDERGRFRGEPVEEPA